MGNKLSCSCAPLIRSKTYRYEDSPWQAGARGGMGGGGGRRGDTGHLLRCGSLRDRKRCAYHTIQPLNHSPFDHVTTLSLQWYHIPLDCMHYTDSLSVSISSFFFLPSLSLSLSLSLFLYLSIYFSLLLSFLLRCWYFLTCMRIKHVMRIKLFFHR